MPSISVSIKLWLQLTRALLTLATIQTTRQLSTQYRQLSSRLAQWGRRMARRPKVPTLSDLEATSSGGDASAAATDELGAVDKPPAGKPPRQRRPSEGRPKREVEMIARLTQFYGAVGALTYAFNQADGQVIMAAAADRATEMVNVARHHAHMWTVLEAMTTGGDYVPLIVGHGSLAMAIMANHGVTLQSIMAKRPPKVDGQADAQAATWAGGVSA